MNIDSYWMDDGQDEAFVYVVYHCINMAQRQIGSSYSQSDAFALAERCLSRVEHGYMKVERLHTVTVRHVKEVHK